MKRGLLAAISAATMAFTVPAFADSINWGQWGYVAVVGSLSGVTADGVAFTITSPGTGFEVLQQGVSWFGIFPTDAPVLFDGDTSGDDSITFATPITSLTLAAEADLYGAFNEYMYAYDASSTLVDAENVLGLTSTYAPGTETFFTVAGPGIVTINVGTSNDSLGFGLGGGSVSIVPEPSTWAMMLLGFAGLGFAGYRKAKASAVFAA
jgi:PEP-CTERM motif